MSGNGNGLCQGMGMGYVREWVFGCGVREWVLGAV